MSAGDAGSGNAGRTAIDWAAVRARLDAVQAAGERAWTPGAAETGRILRARALALAAEPGAAPNLDQSIEVVEFLLAHERYAVASAFVREVYPLENFTPLPCTPAFLLGIVNLRGEIVSVVDVRKFFDLPQTGLQDLNKLIVLDSGNMVFGILADGILGMRRIALADIQPSLPTLTGIRADYLQGVTAERVVVLDAEKLLADRKLIVEEQVAG
ncbi:MAG: chemotaxis protein [Gammaproteobacteria bacterium RIFCSPLOWO2_02_FULL_61_13]|nr:MAG: chemotaxis protein [Gammaproteobacteria bacterium RIFCSPLOWO2_02_FULL_61_13]